MASGRVGSRGVSGFQDHITKASRVACGRASGPFMPIVLFISLTAEARLLGFYEPGKVGS